MTSGGAPGNTVTPFAFGGNHHGHDHGDDEDCQTEDRVQTLVDLPAPVRGRVAALRKLQISTLMNEAEFYKAVHKLEMDFSGKFDAINAQREKVVSGETEPTADEAKFSLFSDAETELAAKFTEALAVAQPNSADNEVQGIPDFWLTVLQNVGITQDMIQEADEAPLRALTDIKVRLTTEPMGFVLEFHFKENEYFTSNVINKTYTMKCEPDMKDPADFDGPEIVSTTGTTIAWKEGKNITVKLVKKKQKNKKQAGQTRFVTKQVKAESFFNFFEPPAHSGAQDDEGMSDEDRMLLHCDFEIGQTIRDTVVPHALFHFTGEAQEMDDDDEYDEEDEDGSEDGDDGEDDE
jgi:hypothetical protein